MSAASSWRARLELGFRKAGSRTVLAHRRHVGPLVVQRPFYPEGGICHVYLVHPPGGIVGGDELELDVDIGAGAHALITTPAATRFYRAGPHPRARLRQQLRVRDAAIEWLPQETIVFDGARACSQTCVELSGDARFFGWEVACLGRPANQERFESGMLQQDFSLHVDGTPVLMDRLRVQGGSPALAGAWGLAGRQAVGTLMMYPAREVDLAALRDLKVEGVESALTLVDGVLLCRAMGAQAEPIRNLFTHIWLQLRELLMGVGAVAPRIWAT